MTIPILQNDKVALLPLEEQHLEQLQRIAQNKAIWPPFAVDGSAPAIFRQSLEARDQQVFVIVDRNSNLIIGSTRYIDINLQHRKLEIGWTWLHPDHWGKGYNSAAKGLLIQYAFENLAMLRIQFAPTKTIPAPAKPSKISAQDLKASTATTSSAATEPRATPLITV